MLPRLCFSTRKKEIEWENAKVTNFHLLINLWVSVMCICSRLKKKCVWGFHDPLKESISSHNSHICRLEQFDPFFSKGCVSDSISVSCQSDSKIFHVLHSCISVLLKVNHVNSTREADVMSKADIWIYVCVCVLGGSGWRLLLSSHLVFCDMWVSLLLFC